MDHQLSLKGKTLGVGKPLVCVPVMGKKRAEILAEAQRLLAARPDMIEWRADAFEEAEKPGAVRAVLDGLEPLMTDTILVFTVRTKAQGGQSELFGEPLRAVYMAAAESGAVDLIDVEFFEWAKRAESSGDNTAETGIELAEREITRLQALGVHVIASHHNFQETPARERIRRLLDTMQAGAADVVKLALMPQRLQDVFALMEETYAFHEAHPNRPLITMSMGRMGLLSRVAGEFTGSCVTFGAGARASAPGQIAMEELAQVLAVLHHHHSI